MFHVKHKLKRVKQWNVRIANTDGYECYPFNGPNSHEKIKWTVIKHQANNKIMALIFEIDSQLLIDIKLDPDKGDILRQNIKGVYPGYHMNKVHWNTIAVNRTSLTKDEMHELIKESAKLTLK